MDNAPDPKVCEALRDICRRISVAHDLDVEIQEELYGHMEDKAIAYLSGQEPLTGRDALLLVREHFGDPAVVKSLLQDVHVEEARVSAARRILGILILSMRLFLVVPIAACALALGAAWWMTSTVLPPPPQGLVLCGFLLALAFSVALLWRRVTRWQRALDAHEQPWPLTQSMGRLLLHAGAVFLLLTLLPWVYSPVLMNLEPDWLAIIFVLATAALLIAHATAWIRWCDQPPRRARLIANVLGVWVLFWIASVARPHMELALYPGVSPDPSPGTHYLLAHGALPGGAGPWQLSWVVPTGAGMLFSVASNILALAALAGLGWLLYALTRRLKRSTGPVAAQ